MSQFVQYLVSGIALGSAFALVASGIVLIYRVTGVVNFAQGSFAVLGGLVTFSTLGWGLPHGPAEVVALLFCGAFGFVAGVIVLGRSGTPSESALIISLGIGILVYAPAVIIWGDQPVSFDALTGSFTVGGISLQRQYLLVVAVAAIAFAAMAGFFTRTYLGKGMTACASNPEAAAMVGINVRKMGILAFTFAGVLGALAGLLVTPLQPVSFNSDVSFALNGFAVAVFGGLRRPGLAFVGGLFLGVAESLVAGYYQPAYQLPIALLLMISVLVWQSRGKVLAA